MSARSGSLGSTIRERVAVKRGAPPATVEEALARVLALHGVDFSRARVRAGFARGHLIDVVLSVPGGVADERERDAAESLLDLVLGPARADDWLGEVMLTPAPRGGLLKVLDARAPSDDFFPLAALPAAFDRAIAGLYAGLPDEPLWSQGGEHLWTMLEASAEPAQDYAAQDDLLLASTYLPEMLKCFLSGSPFASSRFSRHGEIFSYLKTEMGARDPRLSLSARRVLEDALDAALVSERAGRVVGSGLGVRYAYVDFALFDVDRAIAAVTSVARKVGLPERSWLLFCDTLLEGEWAPVHPNGPAPP